MSKVLSELRSIRRPAPPGVGRESHRVDRPPDGWIPLDPGFAVNVGVRIDRTLLSAADAGAREITRRRFLKRLGQFGLATGLTLSGWLWNAGPSAAVDDDCNAFETDPPGNAGPCGPSPRCHADSCQDVGGNCKAVAPHTEKRAHNNPDTCCSTSCTGNANCWVEDCCDRAAMDRVRCCDCCGMGGNDLCIAACGGTACICEQGIGGCP